ncbi:MAG: leucine-rich repeat protein [Bacteroidales bacterium]|nr:leucine-rich repeat protein [Bacteroidales bacterium]
MKKILISALMIVLATGSLSAQTIIDSVLYITEGTTKIADKAYKGNCDFNTVVIPSSVKTIGISTFQNSSNLKKLVIPGNVKKIGDNAFAGCANLEEVVMEEGVETICLYAFYNCPKLISVTMPLSLQKVVPDGLYWQNKSTRVFHCYAGSDAYNLALKNGFKTEILGFDAQKADSITQLVYSTNEIVYPIDIECKNLQIIQIGKAKTITAGAFQKCPAERIDLTSSITSIGENAFNDKTKLRIPLGSYAEQWALQNGYYLCEACADLSIYTKDASLKIDENFERILCNSDTPFDIDYYHFNVAHPLTLDIVDGRLELTSYMLYPCENVIVKKTDSIGAETEISTYSKIQPLSRYVVLTEADEDATYTVSADDEFYKMLNEIPMKWEIKYTQVRQNGKPGNWLIMKAPQCREWISLVTQLAYAFGSEEFKEYFLTAENRFFTGDASLGHDSKIQNYLSLEQVAAIYEKLLVHKLQLGALDDRRNGNVAGMGSCPGSLLGIDEPQLGRHYSGSAYFGTFAHELMHNMGYNHDSNLCGNSSNGIKFQGEFEQLAKQFKDAGCLPYNDETILATNLYWYDDYYFQNKAIEDDESYANQIVDSVLIVCKGAKEIKKQEFKGNNEILEISFPVSLTKINSQSFNSCSNLKSLTIPEGVKFIGNAAFQNCTSLASLEIPSSVREIGDNAFSNTGIDTIVIPESVTSVGKSVTSKGVVWKVKYGSAAYYAALTNNYPIDLLPVSDEEIAEQIIADSENAEAASTEGWQTDDFTSSYERRTWDFSNELKGAGTYTITFKYTSGSHMLCLADALFTADGNPVGFVAERRTAGLNPKQIVYEINVPDGTENLMFYALAQTGGGTDSKGTIKVEYLGNNGEVNNGENQNGNNEGNEQENNNNENPETAVTESAASVNIYAVGRTIIIENAIDEIRVYDVIGKLVCRDATRNVSTEICVNESGVYIVKTGDMTRKIVIK